MTTLAASNIHVTTGKAHIVKGASLTLTGGELVALIGPNGAGKTSLLRAALGLEAISAGTADIDGEAVHGMSPETRARRVAYLPQQRHLAWPSRVKDVVALGRFAYGAPLSAPKGEDARAIETAMADADIVHLAHRRADTLSGGEVARMHIARALAAQAPLLLADEPVAALDPRHQLRVMDLIKAYVARGGSALVVLHDLSLAASYATRLIWMQNGTIVADGPPQETLTPQRMADVFGVTAEITGRDVLVRAAL